MSKVLPDTLVQKIKANVHDGSSFRKMGEIDLDMHMRVRRLGFAERALSRKRLYLDQRFWIFCRDAALGKPQKPEHITILELLRAGVQNDLIWCPVVYAVWAETMKQGEESRLATAKIVDELSGGIALEQPLTRAIRELSYFTWKHLLGVTSPKPCSDYVWRSVGQIVGEAIVTGTPFRPGDQLFLQKSMYDLQSAMSMTEMIEMMGGRSYREDAEQVDVAQHRHLEALRRSDFDTFAEAFAIEIEGVLDLYEEQLQEFAEDLFRKQQLVYWDKPPTTSRELARNLIAIVGAGLKMGRLSTELPTLHIPAGIHAAKRHRRQNYQKGDLLDIHHATAALGYCDAFFTECSLGTLLREKPLCYAHQYECTVLFKEDEIIRYLQEFTP